ncbi:MAG: hypothetical protein AAGI46_01455 [Planctomycetota bacterium]
MNDAFLDQPLTKGDRWSFRLLLVLLLGLTTACGSSEYRTEISPGLLLCRFHGDGRFLTRNGRPFFIVPPEITDLRIIDGYVVGRLGPPDDLTRFEDRSGYFIMRETGSRPQLGLTEAEWRQALADAGLPGDLSVSGIPSRYNTSPAARAFNLLLSMSGLGVVTLVTVFYGFRRRFILEAPASQRESAPWSGG